VSIGETLAQAREKAGLTVDDVAARTRLRRTLVSKIEEDDFSLCGGDFYSRGHLRNIAVVVGIDPEPLIAEYDRTYAESAAPRASEVFESETAARPERTGPNWTAAMAAALVLVLGYAVVTAFTGDDGNRRRTVAEREATTTAPATPTTSAPAPTPSESAVAQAPRDKVTVVLRAKGTSWVRATSGNGKELFEGLIEDESMTFTDRSLVRLVLGNAGAVALTVNGQQIGAPGKAGQVARVEFTRDDPSSG
jgi:cytoskeleton protein RodZ